MAQKDNHDLTEATVIQWDEENGIGVATRAAGPDVWFHMGIVDDKTPWTLRVGEVVDVEIEDVPQEEYSCRATYLRRRS